MKSYLTSLFEGKTLSQSDAEAVLGLVLDGSATSEQIAAVLTAIQVRGETKAEILGFLSAIDSRATRVSLTGKAFDTCGTGGDGSLTFNISTATALLLASTGVNVAKHGNRSVSSLSGSADVLEALGIPTDLTASEAAIAVENKGFGFLFAPRFHPTFAAVSSVRRALGVRTIFNLLGPLANPAPIHRRIIGLFDVNRLPLIAQVLQERGEDEAMVVASDDGMDEISLSSPTQVAHLKKGEILRYEISPQDFGIESANVASLRGGDPSHNAKIIERVLCGELEGPCLDVVLMNTAAALTVAGRASDFREGMLIGRQAIRSGDARQVLGILRQKVSA